MAADREVRFRHHIPDLGGPLTVRQAHVDDRAGRHHLPVVLISLIYGYKLNGLQSADDAVIWMDEGQLCYIFNVEDDRFYLEGVADDTVQKRIQFTLREKLHQVMPVENKVISLVEQDLRYSHENKALIFHEKPEAEEEKALQQLVKRYIQENKISGTALREWNALEVQWREKLTAFLQQLPENRTATMSMYSIFGQMGQSMKDVEETTNDLLTNSEKSSTSACSHAHCVTRL